MPDLRMRADQMRFYDRICKFKIAAFVLHICTSVSVKLNRFILGKLPTQLTEITD